MMIKIDKSPAEEFNMKPIEDLKANLAASAGRSRLTMGERITTSKADVTGIANQILIRTIISVLI